MAESTAVMFANAFKLMPPFKVENAVESNSMDDFCADTTPDSDPDREATPLCLAETAVEMPEESVEFTVCNPTIVLESDVDADATPLCLAETAVEIPEEITLESVSCKVVATLESDEETEDTPIILYDTLLEFCKERDASLLLVAENKLDNAVDNEVTELVRVSVAVEIPEDVIMSTACSVEAATDNEVDTNVSPLILAEILDVNDFSVAEMTEYS